MDRRRFLGLAVTGGLAGCIRGSTGTGEPSSTEHSSTRVPSGTRSLPPTTDPEVPLARRGTPANICRKDLLPTGIVSVVEPTFAADWSDHDTAGYGGELAADAMVVGLTDRHRARAYPLDVLGRHEVVNDEFGRPVIVTYCPLCASGLVAEPVVDGAPATFGVSGRLWRPPEVPTRRSRAEGRVFGASYRTRTSTPRPERDHNLVMYDAATGSYWSQLLATAICGPRRGDSLPIVPSTVASWRDWRAEHPDTEVLLPPPHSTARNPSLPATGRPSHGREPYR